MNTYNRLSTKLLLVIVCLEILCHTFWLKSGNPKVSSIVYLIAGLSIAILPLVKKLNSENSIVPHSKSFKLSLFLFLGLLLAALCFIIVNASNIFSANPMSSIPADMLLVIEIMAKRFVAGEPIYSNVTGLGADMIPVYLPAMWLPFIISVFFEMDVRITTVVSLIFTVLLCLQEFVSKRQLRKTLNLKSLVVFLPLGLMLWGIFKIDSRIIIMTQEFVVVFFYMLLGLAIFKNKTGWIIIALTFCLMSRYTLAPWLLMYLVYQYLFVNKKEAIKIGLGTGILSFLMLLIFQALPQIPMFIGLQDHYLQDVLAHEWKYAGLIQKNLGMAKFFDFQNIESLHQFQIGLSLIIPAVLLLIFYKFKDRINKPFFAICSLKLCLVFFYNFIIIPYLYLFYTSTFLSILIFSLHLKSSSQKKLLSTSNNLVSA